MGLCATGSPEQVAAHEVFKIVATDSAIPSNSLAFFAVDATRVCNDCPFTEKCQSAAINFAEGKITSGFKIETPSVVGGISLRLVDGRVEAQEAPKTYEDALDFLPNVEVDAWKLLGLKKFPKIIINTPEKYDFFTDLEDLFRIMLSNPGRQYSYRGMLQNSFLGWMEKITDERAKRILTFHLIPAISRLAKVAGTNLELRYDKSAYSYSIKGYPRQLPMLVNKV